MDKLAATGTNNSLAVSDSAREYITGSISANTRRAYDSDFQQFSAWCMQNNRTPLPSTPGTLADYFSYLAKEAGKRYSTIDRARAAIRFRHKLNDLPDPTANKLLSQVLSGIMRDLGTAKNKKTAVLTNDIKAMLNTLPAGILGIRNRALLLIGFAGAFRRSELVSITVENIENTAEGVRILLPRSKTDQDAAGRYVGINRGAKPDTCPVRALAAWLAAADITSGSVFRRIDRHGRVYDTTLTPQSVALVVKTAVEAAGLDPQQYSGHSLRAGLVTQAAISGASETNIMRQTGHRSADTVRGYVRIANIFKDNVSGLIGL